MIVNNCFARADKNEKRMFESKWNSLNDYALDSEYGAAACFISDGKIRAVGLGEVILSFNYESMINRGFSMILKIQKVRYGNKIEYEIDIENEILQEWIVKLTLQPLIENSIYHGIKEMRGKGIIRIKGWKEKNKVFIQVSDNGLGIPEEKLEELFSKDYREKGSAFGLFNIQQRLQIYFGKEYGLTVESKLSQGTKATVCIPVDFKREEDRK